MMQLSHPSLLIVYFDGAGVLSSALAFARYRLNVGPHLSDLKKKTKCPWSVPWHVLSGNTPGIYGCQRVHTRAMVVRLICGYYTIKEYQGLFTSPINHNSANFDILVTDSIVNSGSC